MPRRIKAWIHLTPMPMPAPYPDWTAKGGLRTHALGQLNSFFLHRAGFAGALNLERLEPWRSQSRRTSTGLKCVRVQPGWYWSMGWIMLGSDGHKSKAIWETTNESTFLVICCKSMKLFCRPLDRPGISPRRGRAIPSAPRPLCCRGRPGCRRRESLRTAWHPSLQQRYPCRR
jgi:hypothetical protein